MLSLSGFPIATSYPTWAPSPRDGAAHIQCESSVTKFSSLENILEHTILYQSLWLFSKS